MSLENVILGPLQNSQYIHPFRMNYTESQIDKQWDLIRTHRSVAIVIFNTSRRKLVCVKQFRPGVYYNSLPVEARNDKIDPEKYPRELGVTLEWCAGMIDKNKSTEEIAVDEVYEECGYRIMPSQLQLIQTFRSAVGVCGEQMTMYYVPVTDDMRASQGGGLREEGEIIDVTELSLDEAYGLLHKKTINSPAEFMFGLSWFFSTHYPFTA